MALSSISASITPKADKSAELLVRRTRVRLRVMPLISLNLLKIQHFWIGICSVLLLKPWMDTIYPECLSERQHALVQL